jgi:hypothetical protein
LLRQNFLEGFRGQQVNLRNIDTQGPRDALDPAAIEAAIDKAKEDLAQRFEAALREIASR